MKEKLRALYYGNHNQARLFRFSLLIIDLYIIFFFVFATFMETQAAMISQIDLFVAGLLIIDYSARFYISPKRLTFPFHFHSILDLIVILSLTAGLLFANLGFLRIVRMLRLIRSYHMIVELRQSFPWFKRNEDVIQSSANLLVFIFIVTAIVFVAQENNNPAINSYSDALYFTVTTLTTTGFGDITLTGPWGRFISVAIMILGVALFLRLVQTIFRPPKVSHVCPRCGLHRHDIDAIHCKHCGGELTIPTTGEWG